MFVAFLLVYSCVVKFFDPHTTKTSEKWSCDIDQSFPPTFHNIVLVRVYIYQYPNRKPIYQWMSCISQKTSVHVRLAVTECVDIAWRNIHNILLLSGGSYRMCWHRLTEYTEYIIIVWWKLHNVLTSPGKIYKIYCYYLVGITECVDIAWRNIQNILLLPDGSYRMCWHRLVKYT